MGDLSIMKYSHPVRGDQTAKLLIPIDATDESRWAINYAIRRAQAGAAIEVYLLYVYEPIKTWEVLRFHTEQEVRQRFEERSTLFLTSASEPLAAAGILFHRHCREDELVRGILTFAEENGCTEIVVPRTNFLGLFSYGLASKLAVRSNSIPVVLSAEDGTTEG